MLRRLHPAPARKAFFGHVPIPLVHIDTSFKIPDMIAYRDRLAADWNLQLIYGQRSRPTPECFRRSPQQCRIPMRSDPPADPPVCEVNRLPVRGD